MPFKLKKDLVAYEKKRNATPKRKKARTMNAQARRLLAKKLGKKAIKNRDVDHIKPITKGGTNKLSNLRVMSKHKNRSRRSK